MKKIDARGLACPGPVLQTKAALDTENCAQICVQIDNEASRQNVQRFLESQGFAVTTRQDGSDINVIGSRDTVATALEAAPASDTATHKIAVMCATDRMGSGDDDLGAKLMINFIRTLKEIGPDLWRLILVNNGVKLAIEGAPVLDDLKALEADGVTILVCGTCLDHFNLLDKKQVGQTTNMLDVVTSLQLADKTIHV